MRKSLPAIIIIFCMLYDLAGQVQPQHEKRIYLSPEGKIFINKDLPVYFWVSSSPSEKAQHYRLPSESTPQYANPMYFDTNGRNTLRSPSAVDTVTKEVILPKQDVQFQVYSDGTSPESNLIPSLKNELLIKNCHYSSDSIFLKLLAKDDLSGVAGLMVSVDSGEFIAFNEKFELIIEKKYVIQYYAYDNTGNVEPVKKAFFRIDRTAPTTKLLVEGDNHNNILSGTTTIDLKSEDTVSGLKNVFVSVDSGSFKIFAGKIKASFLGQGAHLLRYYAEDRVGNKEKIGEYSFYVDLTPPQVIEEIVGKTFIANGREYSAGTSKLKLSAFDNKAGVKDIYYAINDQPFEKYEKPLVLSGYKGNLVVRSYAVDHVNNKSLSNIENTRKNQLAYVDLGAPWVGYSFSGPQLFTRDTTFISHKTSIRLSAKDTESGIQKIEYQIDSLELELFKNDISLNIEGLHQITIFGYDNTDNLTRQSFEIVVDTTGPVIFDRFSSLSLGALTIDSISIPVYSANVVLFLSATDEKAGYENLLYSLNNAPAQNYQRDIRGFVSGRKNVVKIIAVDKLGNKSEREIEFYIK